MMPSFRVYLVLVLATASLCVAAGAAPASSPVSNGEIAYSTILFIQAPLGDLQDDFDICAIGARGGRARQLRGLDPKEPRFTISPTWSRDGRRLAFSTRTPSETNYSIATMNADGSDRALIPGVEDGYGVSFGPGDLIAFQNGRREIYTVHLDGTGLTRIRTGARDPAWSPDGARLVYFDLAGRHLSLMNPDGSDPVRLTSDNLFLSSPSWSPDGKRIAFGAMRGRGRFSIEAVNADGSGRKSLRQNVREDVELGVTWSPDGTKLAFTQFPSNESSTDIYVMDDDGSSVRNITNSPFGESDPAWRPLPAEGTPPIPRDPPTCGLGGGSGNDVVAGSRWPDFVETGGGNDKIRTFFGRDVILAGAGNDTIWAGDRTDFVFAEDGNDAIYGQGGRDVISGGKGNDRIVGGSGHDSIHGEQGDDVIFVRDGTRDEVDCGRGRDVVYADRQDRLSRTCEVVHRS